jgi:hypothetical protein
MRQHYLVKRQPSKQCVLILQRCVSGVCCIKRAKHCGYSILLLHESALRASIASLNKYCDHCLCCYTCGKLHHCIAGRVVVVDCTSRREFDQFIAGFLMHYTAIQLDCDSFEEV